MAPKEIPGYYYDPVRKRYFSITKDFKPPPPPPPPTSPKAVDVDESKKETQVKSTQHTIPMLMYSRAMHGMPPTKLKERKKNLLVKHIDFTSNNMRSFDDHGDCPSDAKICFTGKSLALHLKPYGSYLNETLCLYNIVSGRNFSQIDFKTEMKMSLPGCRISSFAWCPNDEKRVLFSMVREHSLQPGHVLRSSELALLGNQGLVTLKVYNRRSIECVAWNRYPKDNTMICTGELQGVVKLQNVDLAERDVTSLSVKSPPQVVTFCTQSPNVFIGCKSGLICQYDYRQEKNIYFTQSNKVPRYCIDCIQVLQDENYFVFSNWNGGIFKFDLRVQKTVQEYKGHVNNHSKLSFVTDDSDDYLFAVGSDACFRCWNLKTAELEFCQQRKRLPGTYHIPIISYSDIWGGDNTTRGLLGIFESRFHIWSLI